MSTGATFDENDHAWTTGWATYHRRLGWRRVLCLFGHTQFAIPEPPNGHSPSNFERCRRCRSALKYYIVGQHRYGGMDR